MMSLKPIHSRRKRRLKAFQLKRVYAVLRGNFGHQRWWPGETPFEIMVGAILTQNTAWTNVEKAIQNLKDAGKLSYRSFRTMRVEAIARLIRPAGFFNIKAGRLKSFVDFLHRECGGDLSRLKKRDLSLLREQLLAVKGVGPETADSILLYALGKRSFVIDAYTRRIFSRHGLAPEHGPYERWREIFMRALPEEGALYNDFHAQIVRTAKEHCRKVARCEACPLRRFF